MKDDHAIDKNHTYIFLFKPQLRSSVWPLRKRRKILNISKEVVHLFVSNSSDHNQPKLHKIKIYITKWKKAKLFHPKDRSEWKKIEGREYKDEKVANLKRIWARVRDVQIGRHREGPMRCHDVVGNGVTRRWPWQMLWLEQHAHRRRTRKGKHGEGFEL